MLALFFLTPPWQEELRAELPLAEFLGDVAASAWAAAPAWGVEDGLAFLRATA